LKGRRPRSSGRTRYDWLSVYAFARPSTGQTFGVLLPRVNADRMSDALAAFAAEVDPDGRKVLLVLLDNAGWHVAKRRAVPPNVVLPSVPPAPGGAARSSRSGRWSGRRSRTARSDGSTASGRSCGAGWRTWPGTRRLSGR